jgi:hypothetical protein
MLHGKLKAFISEDYKFQQKLCLFFGIFFSEMFLSFAVDAQKITEK